MLAIIFSDASMDARNLPDLAVFLEVARCGSITGAAQRLNMVQSNVTARIKKLEQVVAAPLLHRHARGVKPTPAGEAALAIALRVDAVIDDLRFTFGKGSAGHSGKLRVGAIETVLASHLPAVIGNFSQTWPHVDISVRTGSSASLLRAVHDRELDVVFVSRRPPGLGLRHRVAFRDELVVIAPAGADEFRTARWLREGPLLNVLIQRLGCSCTERLLSLLAKSKRRHRLLELGTLDGILAFVEQGLGIAAMPRTFVASAAARRKLRIVRLPVTARQLETVIVAPNADDCTFAANAFFMESLS